MGLLDVGEQELFCCEPAIPLGELACDAVMDELLFRQKAVDSTTLWRGKELRQAQREYGSRLIKDTSAFVRVASKVLDHEVALYLRQAADGA